MAGGKGISYQTNFLTWALSGGTSTRPSSWNVALYTDVNGLSTPPSTEATTSNCAGYARQSVTFSAPSSGQTSNANDVQFTATGAWTTVNYYGILDQSGVMIYWAPLSTSRQLQTNGDKLDFAVGAIVVQEK